MMQLRQETTRTVSEGDPRVLGARVNGSGVSFTVFSRDAEQIWLDLFDPSGKRSDRIRMFRSEDVFHVFVEGIGSGALYGYRAVGPYAPDRGLRFNPYKLLIDPYARAVDREPVDRDGLLRGYMTGGRGASGAEPMDRRDNEAVAPRSVVWAEPFDWQQDRRPDVRREDLVIYEVHLRGFTAHPGSGVRDPGTYAGFVEKIDHLKGLGVNAVELLPVQQSASPAFLVEHGLSDYWGYNTAAFFAPQRGYGSRGRPGCEINELKTLVRELHRAGIAVILDVVYNHTGEGDHTGYTLSLRGLDNRAYYLLEGPEQKLRLYKDVTGARNTLHVAEPRVRQLVLDSLRYWVEEMHVDGFRFDLAPVLGLEHGRFTPLAPLLREIEQDPVLGEVLLIAEPWAPVAYELGRFSPPWRQWNDRFRDAVRRALRGDRLSARELGSRLVGSPDILGTAAEAARASVNFVTCHDGFTLMDLYSYDHKHNQANREDGRDGSDHNLSWNCGVEGPTTDTRIRDMRVRLARTAMACLLFSWGTPMILGGDEMLRSQRGNNNAFCQDNTISWFDWSLAVANAGFLELVRKAIAFRRRRPELGRPAFPAGDRELFVSWYDESGPRTLSDRQVAGPLGWKLRLEGSPEALLFLLGGTAGASNFALPDVPEMRWHRLLDTVLPSSDDVLDEETAVRLDPADGYWISERSLVVLIGKAAG